MNKAQKHTQRVKHLRFILPACGIFLLLVIAWMLITQNRTELPLNYRSLELGGDGPIMRQPIMRGSNKNRPYEITAETAWGDSGAVDIVHMNRMTGYLGKTKQGEEMTLTAPHAQFHRQQDILHMHGGVVLIQSQSERETGRFETQKLSVDLAHNLVRTNAPVKLSSPTGELTANAMRLERDRQYGLFSGHVRLFGQKQSTAEAAHPAPSGRVIIGASFATDPDAPVEVLADRLEIFDAEQRAVFHSNAQPIKATQGRVSLYTRKAVLLTDKTTGEIKHLFGEQDILLVSENGNQATGDWMEYDIRGGQLIMGGAVTLTQKGGKLRGQRLVVNMQTGKSRLLGGVRTNGDQTRVRGIFTPGTPEQSPEQSPENPPQTP